MAKSETETLQDGTYAAEQLRLGNALRDLVHDLIESKVLGPEAYLGRQFGAIVDRILENQLALSPNVTGVSDPPSKACAVVPPAHAGEIV